MSEKPFSKQDVTITLTGEQWVTILARTLHRDLSQRGRGIYTVAIIELQKQLLAKQKEHQS